MKTKILLSIAALLICSTGYSQSIQDVYNFSKSTRTYSTARAAAMGGAFTSLGADAASMSINPAGLGLYHGSEVSLTPSIRIEDTNNFSSVMTKSSKTSFDLNNFNGMFNLFSRKSGTVKSLTIGISYASNYLSSSKYTSKSGLGTNTIFDDYRDQLNSVNPSPNDILNTTDYPYNGYNNYPSGSLWGAINSFNNGIFAHSENDGVYDYQIDSRAIANGDRFNHQNITTYKTRNETFMLSTGLNISDIINVGVTLGVNNFSHSEDLNLTENAGSQNKGDYDKMQQWQTKNTSGVAFDFIIGIIAEPIAGLRAGVSYHAPRVSSVDEVYYIDQEIFYDTESFYTESAIKSSNYEMKSPSKLSTGLSYVISNLGIISVDYERTWYNGMQMRGFGGDGDQILRNEIESTYKATNSLHVGTEAYLGGNFFLRGGYSFTTSPYKYAEQLGRFDGSNLTASAGIGYKGKKFYIDAAYIYAQSNQHPNQYWESTLAPVSKNTLTQHIISLTLGWRF